jgi:peptidoglycan/LPS O-acetylase OafA/YrhL
MVGALYLLSAHPLPTVRDGSGLVDVLFVPMVIALAVGAGNMPRLLSTRVAVYLGQISFSLYMVHELVHTAWNWTAEQFELSLDGTVGKFTVVGLIAIAFAGAAVLYHVVEEPARRWMRRMVDVREVPAQSRAEQDHEPGKLQPVDGVLAPESDTISARAG